MTKVSDIDRHKIRLEAYEELLSNLFVTDEDAWGIEQRLEGCEKTYRKFRNIYGLATRLKDKAEFTRACLARLEGKGQ